MQLSAHAGDVLQKVVQAIPKFRDCDMTKSGSRVFSGFNFLVFAHN